MRYKAVLFDLDGTLINSIFDLADSVNYILKKYDFPQRSIEEITAFVGNGLKNLVKLSLPKNEYNENMYIEFKEHYFNNCCIKTIPYEGIKYTILKIREMGIKTAVVTNKPNSAANEICQKLFEGLFDTVVGEREGVLIKPSAEMINLALKFLNVGSKEALYVGDSEVDILTAKNSNMDLVSVSYGFRTKQELKNAGAVEIVDKPVDIYGFLVNKCG